MEVNLRGLVNDFSSISLRQIIHGDVLSVCNGGSYHFGIRGFHAGTGWSGWSWGEVGKLLSPTPHYKTPKFQNVKKSCENPEDILEFQSSVCWSRMVPKYCVSILTCSYTYVTLCANIDSPTLWKSTSLVYCNKMCLQWTVHLLLLLDVPLFRKCVLKTLLWHSALCGITKGSYTSPNLMSALPNQSLFHLLRPPHHLLFCFKHVDDATAIYFRGKLKIEYFSRRLATLG